MATSAPTVAPDAPPEAPPEEGTSCGDLGCLAFSTPQAAFAQVLAERPRVLAIGEAHALAGSEVPSVTHRFTTELLPLLEGRASSLVVELLLPDPRCKRETEVVRQEQKVVTKQQSETNQNEFVTLGHAAKALGVEPFPLRPSCERLTRIAEAGPDTVVEMLLAITELTDSSVRRLLARDAAAGRDVMVVPYGGAMHNDLSPNPARAEWSFGPALSAHVGGRYVELDLIVPEFIKDTDAWRRLPWYGVYDPKEHGGATVLFRVAPRSYVLIFPLTQPGSSRRSGPPPGP